MVAVTMVAMVVGHDDSAMILNNPGRACIYAGLYVCGPSLILGGGGPFFRNFIPEKVLLVH